MASEFSSFEDGFSAIINKISLFDYMQLMMMTQKNKTIEVKQGRYFGVIQIVNGKITFAKTSTRKLGMNAIFEIMLLDNGNFTEIEIEKELSPNIEDNGNILLQVAEYMDKVKNSEIKADKAIKKTVIEDKDSLMLMKNLKETDLLKKSGKHIEGILELAIIDTNDKIISNVYFEEEKIILKSLYFTELIKDTMEIFKFSQFGTFEEVTFSSSEYHFLIKMINKKYFLGIAILKDKGSLGFVKLESKKIVSEIQKLLVK